MPEITQTSAAERLGITPQALGRWARRPGAPVVLRDGRPFCLWPDFPRWREAELECRRQRTAKPLDLEAAQARRMVALARMAELAQGKMEGRLVDVDEAAGVVDRMLTQLRAQLLNFPQRWAPRLVGVKTIPEAAALLDDGVRELMALLRGDASE